MIQQNFIDMENMLDLLTAQPTIVDSEDAIVLDQNKDGSGGKIQFDNVCFSYNQEVALQDISFTILPGQKVALVGPTGGGKRYHILILALYLD